MTNPTPLNTEEEIDKLLPRHNCPPSCDGYGTYGEMDENGDPEPAQCQWCYEVVIPLREAIKALLDTHVREAEIRGQIKAFRSVPDFRVTPFDDEAVSLEKWLWKQIDEAEATLTNDKQGEVRL